MCIDEGGRRGDHSHLDGAQGQLSSRDTQRGGALAKIVGGAAGEAGEAELQRHERQCGRRQDRAELGGEVGQHGGILRDADQALRPAHVAV